MTALGSSTCTVCALLCSGATWGIDRIDSREGTDSKYDDSGATGSGTVVYILDTGIRISHNDFAGRAEAGVRANTPDRAGYDAVGHDCWSRFPKPDW